ncbi:50S ribosomal protein L29, chloroplastic-like [Durio zibethinus]|uniref:Large ribosomal subunit protein uL29c n=1 Tax=Durio zibethinus TaxID=66656 RepID=A0A6P5ZFE2_DURZI|nr:50S ribosomal protein L29, chloroplastic-like [Durio zibethinus]
MEKSIEKNCLICIPHGAEVIKLERKRAYRGKSHEDRAEAKQPKMLSLSIASAKTVTLPPKPKSSIPKTSFTGVRIQHLCPQRLHSQTTSVRKSSAFSSVVMMAKREEELKEIRPKTTEEINDEVVELKGELFMLRLQKSVRNEFKSSEFRRMRKSIARMLTVKREREIEEGINKRLSRKLDRQWKKSIVVRPPLSLIKLREQEAAEEAEKSAA